MQAATRFYLLLVVSLLAGYAWLLLAFNQEVLRFESPVTVCLFKNITGIPCPSCGITRAVLAFLKGAYSQSFYLNPLGFIVILFLFFIPLWIIADLVFKRKTLFSFYHRFELFFKKKYVAFPAIGLVLINWIWNICKGL